MAELSFADAGPVSTAADQAVLDAAEVVVDYFEHADDPEDPRVDKSDCPYNRRGLPGADPNGTCSYGCIDEPSCHTDGPWPMDALAIAVRARREARHG